MFNKKILKTLVFGTAIVIIMTMAQCASKTAPILPRDIFGISVGMSKTDAENHLKEIGKLIREDKKREEVWVLKDDSRFSHLAVGFNKENQVRYVTAMARPDGKMSIKPDEIGSLTDAKQEINGPNYRYIWKIPARENQPAYSVIAQGNQPERIALYTLSALDDKNSSEEEEEEREKRK